MKLPGQKIQEELPRLRKMVEKSHTYFQANYKRFNDFRKFVYETSISQRENDINNELGRPNIEANVLTAYHSRLCGEFSKQEPSIEVAADEGAQIDSQVIQVVEGHFRHILEEAKTCNTQYLTYRDELSGGFTNLHVFTDYAHENSLDQVIKFRKAKYPTMVGYDPLATEPHKGDGQYSFKCIPKTKEECEEEFDIDLSDTKFLPVDSQVDGFVWSFNNSVDDMILICDLKLKKKKKVRINEVVGHGVKTDDEYEQFAKEWQSSRIEPVPIISRSRRTTRTIICRYVFTESVVLSYEETDFKYLPDVFVDGDSVDLYDDSRGSLRQFTRPYAFDAKGAQQLKNLGVQCLAQYLERMAQHKYIVKKEAIPQEKSYLDALTYTQKANTLVVNAFKDNNPNMPIPDPIMPIQPQAAPPEISNTIQLADTIIQNNLGSYDAQLGINDNQLSGIAIVEAATQNNAAAMPFVVNYMQALNQVAQIVIDLMPKYYKTPMTIPVIDKNGKRSAVKINQPGGIDFNYDSNMLQVKVSAGVNFAIQKNRALGQLISLCQAVPGFAGFIQEMGLEVVLDNLEIRGVDMLKELAQQYMQKMQAVQAHQMQAQQQAMQNNPNMINAQTKAQQAQADAALKAKELQLQEQELQMKLQQAEADRQAAFARAQAEEVRAEAQLKMAHMDQQHQHGKDVVQMAHTINEANLNRQERQQNAKENQANEESSNQS